jgi:hypothetical protein
MKIRLLALPIFALSLGSISLLNSHAQGALTTPPSAYAQERGDWENPPSEFREVERQGYRDGHHDHDDHDHDHDNK